MERKIERHVETNKSMQAKLFMRRSKVNINSCEIETIFKWIRNIKRIMKKVKEMPSNDIRRYFES